MQEYTTEHIENAILAKFDDFKDCADALKISESTLYRNRKRATKKFIKRLESVGVKLGGPFKVNEPPPEYISEVSEMSKRLSKLEEIVADKEIEIRELKKVNDKLREENERLSVQSDQIDNTLKKNHGKIKRD